MGYPQIIHLSQGFSVINHPAIGYPHVWKPPMYGNPRYLENISGIFSWEWHIFMDLASLFLKGRRSGHLLKTEKDGKSLEKWWI
jgi:hypothetical protein